MGNLNVLGWLLLIVEFARTAQRQLESNPHAKLCQRKSLLAAVQGIAAGTRGIVQFATNWIDELAFFECPGQVG
jgi:hypothetical protein